MNVYYLKVSFVAEEWGISWLNFSQEPVWASIGNYTGCYVRLLIIMVFLVTDRPHVYIQNPQKALSVLCSHRHYFAGFGATGSV